MGGRLVIKKEFHCRFFFFFLRVVRVLFSGNANWASFPLEGYGHEETTQRCYVSIIAAGGLPT